MSELYFIQDSRDFHGNAVVWWGVDGCGYTSDITKAGMYTKEKAEGICQRKTDIAWRADYILNNKQAIKQIVDMQYLSKSKSGIK